MHHLAKMLGRTDICIGLFCSGGGGGLLQKLASKHCMQQLKINYASVTLIGLVVMHMAHVAKNGSIHARSLQVVPYSMY